MTRDISARYRLLLGVLALLASIAACGRTDAEPRSPIQINDDGPIVSRPSPAESSVRDEAGIEPSETPIPVLTVPTATTPAEPRSPSSLADALAEILASDEDAYGVVVEHVDSGERLVHNPRQVFPSGSVYKLGLAVETLRRVDEGNLNLDDVLTIQPGDAIEPEPDGGLGPGDEATVQEVLQAMMSVSSNAAGHALLRRLGRVQINAAFAALGLQDTRIATEEDEDSVTTPADMAHLLGLVARSQILSDASRDELRRLLAVPEDLDSLASTLPADADVLSKVGNLERASSIAALISTRGGAVIVCVLDDDVDPGDARNTIARIGKAVYRHYTPVGLSSIAE